MIEKKDFYEYDQESIFIYIIFLCFDAVGVYIGFRAAA